MQTRIRWNLLLQAIEERERMKKELETSVAELAQIRMRLSEMTQFKLQRKKIKQLEEQIEREGQYCLLFANTITNVYRFYQINEARLTDYSETVRRTAKRESLSCQNLIGLRELFYRVF